jgi:hypothetical protein
MAKLDLIVLLDQFNDGFGQSLLGSPEPRLYSSTAECERALWDLEDISWLLPLGLNFPLHCISSQCLVCKLRLCGSLSSTLLIFGSIGPQNSFSESRNRFLECAQPGSNSAPILFIRAVSNDDSKLDGNEMDLLSELRVDVNVETAEHMLEYEC